MAQPARPRQGLARRWRDKAARAGQLDDHAYFALGFIDLYGATFDPVWLERAVAVTEEQIARFWDAKDGGFFESPAGDPNVRVRMKDDFDGAEMAGNSIAALNLLALAALLDRDDWRGKAETALEVQFSLRAPGQGSARVELSQRDPRRIGVFTRGDATTAEPVGY